MTRPAYRPRVSIPNNVAFGVPNPVVIAMRSDKPPIQIDWCSDGYAGITTDDPDAALAWMAEAQALGLTTSHGPSGPSGPGNKPYKSRIPRLPLRRIMERGAGSSTLECGHVINTPHNPQSLRARCALCLPLAARLHYLKSLKRKLR